MTKGLIDDEQGVCVDQIFALKQKGEKAQEKKCSVYRFCGPGEGL